MRRGVIAANRHEERRQVWLSIPPPTRLLILVASIVLLLVLAAIGSTMKPEANRGTTTSTSMQAALASTIDRLGDDVSGGFGMTPWWQEPTYGVDGTRVVATISAPSSDPRLLCTTINNFVSSSLSAWSLQGTVLRDGAGVDLAGTYSSPGPCN